MRKRRKPEREQGPADMPAFLRKPGPAKPVDNWLNGLTKKLRRKP